jgi:hypothetical protein
MAANERHDGGTLCFGPDVCHLRTKVAPSANRARKDSENRCSSPMDELPLIFGSTLLTVF